MLFAFAIIFYNLLKHLNTYIFKSNPLGSHLHLEVNGQIHANLVEILTLISMAKW